MVFPGGPGGGVLSGVHGPGVQSKEASPQEGLEEQLPRSHAGEEGPRLHGRARLKTPGSSGSPNPRLRDASSVVLRQSCQPSGSIHQEPARGQRFPQQHVP